MPPSNTTCDPAAIERLLSDRLSDEERAAVEKHLDRCATCRDRLEREAAAPTVWSEAREFLSSSEQELPGSDAHGSGFGGQGAWRGDEDAPRADLILNYLSATDDPRMLGRLAGYEIAAVIGHGGMGVVLKGLDVSLDRYVAIKVLAPHLATSAAARLRFAREARAAAAVVHENVIAIHAVSEANGLPFLVMPYVRGTSLQKRLDAQGPLGATEIARIGMQAAAGLAAAHAQGLVHRDIKPANILLEDGIERLTITDFGLARAADDASLTRSGVIAGTPQFMSPEQARGDSVDQRSDLFSLGSVLYALCTGHAPFRAETSYGVLRRISDDRPRPIREQNPEIPDWLCALVERLHAKAPAERFASAEEVAELFQQCLAHIQQPTVVALPDALRRPAPAPAVVPRGRFRKVWNTLVALGVLTTLAWIAWLAAPLPDQGPKYPEPDPPIEIKHKPEAPQPDAMATIPGHPWNDGAEGEIDDLEGQLAGIEMTIDRGWDRIRHDEAAPRRNETNEPPREVAGESAEGPAFVSGRESDASSPVSAAETIATPTEPDDERPPPVAEPTSPTSDQSTDVESDDREENLE